MRLIVFLLCLLIAGPVSATGEGVRILRDAEIEDSLKAFLTPIFKAARLDPKRLTIYVADDSTLNAFASQDSTLVVNSGLLLRMTHLGQLMGVLAHETGHIAGGHVPRTFAAMKRGTMTMIASLVGGIAAGLASGRADVAQAVIGGGLQVGERSFLNYSRGQEAAADAAGVKFLEAAEWSGQGSLEFLEILNQQEMLSTVLQDAYLRSHPITSARVDFMRHHVETSKHSQKPYPEELERRFRFLQAKLRAFTIPPGQTFITISEKDTKPESRYARAIALFRDHKLTEALAVMDLLIADFEKENHALLTYIYELKGQMLFESGKVKEALPYYQKSAEHSRNPLILTALAGVLLEHQTSDHLRQAAKLLEEAALTDRANPHVWRALATAYGRLNEMGLMALSLAEEALVAGDIEQARHQAKRALTHLKPSQGAAQIRAQDIINHLDQTMQS